MKKPWIPEDVEDGNGKNGKNGAWRFIALLLAGVVGAGGGVGVDRAWSREQVKAQTDALILAAQQFPVLVERINDLSNQVRDMKDDLMKRIDRETQERKEVDRENQQRIRMLEEKRP